MSDSLASFDEVKAALRYEPETGLFFHLRSHPLNRHKAGDRAGSINATRGYVRLMVNKKAMQAHRAAWLLVHGSWPVGEIDHINCDRADNRISNLREVTRSMNAQNKRSAYKNKAEPLGVCFNKKANKFQASIYFNKKLKHLGLFATAEKAHAAYVEAKRIHHEGNTL